jgi:hypothetical protein
LDHDPRAVAAEEIVRALEGPPFRVPGGACDGQQGGSARHSEQPCLARAGRHDLDPLFRLARLQPVLGLQELVQRARQGPVEQTGEALGGKARPLERDRLAIGQPHAHHLEHEVDAQRRRGVAVRLQRRRREHASVGLEALTAQVVRQAREAREVALDLALGHEDPARPPPRATHDAVALEVGQRGTDRRPRDAVPLREIALGPEPLAGRAELVQQPVAGGARGGAEREVAHIASIACGDSGSTWPPSTTID